MIMSCRSAFLILLFGQLIVLGAFLLDNSGLVSALALIGFIVGIIFTYGALGTLTARLITAFAIFLGSARDSVPVAKIAVIRILGIENAFMSSDRLNVSLITVAVFFLLMLIGLLMHASRRKDLGTLAAFAVCSVFLLVKFVIDFRTSPRFSTYQYAVDAIVILTCVLVFFGIRDRDLDLRILRREIWPLVAIIAMIAVIDAVASVSDVVSWARSWRGAYQGILSGSEVYFAVRVCVAAIILRFLFYRKNILLPTKVLVLSPSVLFLIVAAILSDNLTATLIFAMVIIFSTIRSRMRLVTLISIWTTLLMSGFFFLCFFGKSTGIFDIQSSLLSRVATVVAPFSAWSKQPVFGIGSGLFDISHVTNLAASIYDRGYANYLSSLGLGSSISGEALLRSSYDYFSAGGEFVPHFVPAFILYAYGLPSLPFVIVYLFYLPPYFIHQMAHSPELEGKLLSAIGLFLVGVSFFHPVIAIFEIVFVYICLRAFATARTRRQVRSGSGIFSGTNNHRSKRVPIAVFRS